MVRFLGRMNRAPTQKAKLMRKGDVQPAKLSFDVHVLMESRSGFLIDVAITDPPLFEPKAAEPLLARRR